MPSKTSSLIIDLTFINIYPRTLQAAYLRYGCGDLCIERNLKYSTERNDGEGTPLAFYFGAAIALRPFFWASSNLRTMTSHFVALQMCFELVFTSPEKRERPAARSTASTVQRHSESYLLLVEARGTLTRDNKTLQRGFIVNDSVGQNESTSC